MAVEEEYDVSGTRRGPTGFYLTQAEREAMPLLTRGAALRFLLTRSYDWINTRGDALVRPKHPLEYARRLRFHQTIEKASGFGLG